MSKLYFVHVPKTGGRHLTTTVLPYLTMTLRISGLDPTKTLNYEHSFWPSMTEDEKAVLTYRYPPRHSVSHFFYFRPWLVDEDPSTGRDIFMAAMSSSESERIANFQTMFICSTSTSVDITGTNEAIDFDESLLDERLEKVLLAVDGDKLTPHQVTNVYKVSCNYLGVPPLTENTIPIISVPEFALQYSSDVYSLLTEEDIHILEEKNQLDMNLYRILSQNNEN